MIWFPAILLDERQLNGSLLNPGWVVVDLDLAIMVDRRIGFGTPTPSG
jgi:hypothetical protein